jgi:hypothetical protein
LALSLVLSLPAIGFGLSESPTVLIKFLVAFAGVHLVGRLMAKATL